MLEAFSLTNLTPPSPPPWEGAHVLAVHFPIALLLVAPLFVFLAMVLPQRGRWASLSALILLLLGTAGLFVAVASGKAAEDLADGSDAMYSVLERHEDLAELTRNVYAGITGVYALLMLLPLVFPRFKSAIYVIPVQLLFLVVLTASGLLLANTAHLGGRLVHQFGVQAAIADSPHSGDADE